MLVAFIALGAAACEDGLSNEPSSKNESFSFEAEIDNTRVDVVADGEGWKTVWTGDDQLRVVADGKEFIFSNTPEALSTFTSTEAGVNSVASASNIQISSWHGHKDNVVDSDKGKGGLRLETSYTAFPADRKVTLGVESSFFRLSSDSDVQIEATDMIFAGVGSSNGYTTTVTLAAGSDIWVPFYADGASEVSIAVSIDGKVVKSFESLAVEAGGIYELGAFEAEPVLVYLNPGVWNVDGAWFAAYFFNDEGASASVKLTDEDGDSIYECRVPANMKSMIFCRMNPDYEEFAWNSEAEANHVWNQSEDLFIGAEPENYYYILDWAVGVWGNSEGYVAPKASMGVVGSFQNWDVTNPVAMDYAEDGWLVAYGIELFKGDAFKFVEGRTWDEPNYGYEGGKLNAELDKEYTLVLSGNDIVSTKTGKFDIYFNPANKHFKYVLVGELEGTVDIVIDNRAEWNPLYIHLSHNGVAITPEEGALIEGATYPVSIEYIGETLSCYFTTTDKSTEPQNVTITKDGATAVVAEDSNTVIPGAASEWALLGVFSGWADTAMLTTNVDNLVVLQNVTLNAADGFLVRKPSTDWADKYGAGGVNYIKANHYIETAKEGADMCVEASGVYDVYFNYSNHNLYVVEAGADYTTAVKQTVSGEEPKQEEPEVTDKVVYLKPSNNWKESGARFAIYVWGAAPGEKWVSMTDCGDGTYKAFLPEGYDYGCNIIFCRMNPNTSANNWNNKWNQTSDLKTPTDGKNMYTVTEGTWDNGGGTWSTK